MTKDELSQAKEYLKYEILAQQHNAEGLNPQSKYCDKQCDICFNALNSISGGNAFNIINEVSEKHYSEIEKEALRLDENYGIEY